MKLTRVSLFFLCATLGSSIPAQEKPVDTAKKADLAWLSLVDSAKYKESWDVASPDFKSKVAVSQWEQAVKSARAPLGAITSRSFQDAASSNTLPGAPDGTYVVIHFQSSFEQKLSAVETVVASLEKDGLWHVAGYFIK